MNTSEAINNLRNLKISRHRRIWKPFMEKYNCQIISEVGVFEGENFRRMIEHGPAIAVAVDLWKETGVVSQNDSGYTQDRLDRIYNTFKSEMCEKKSVKILREDTNAAASRFPDEYFDLIYIDGDHTYEGCKRDIEAWYPKLKKNGFFTGDDYWNRTAPNTGVQFGVKKAVNEFAKKNNLTVYPLPRHGWAIIK